MFYVYIIFRENGSPCYVGKGQGRRYKDHKRSHNVRVRRVYAKAQQELPVVIVRDGMTESEAFSLERTLIKTIGRANVKTGPLYNFTDGGEGVAGLKMSKKARKKMSLAGKGKKHAVEHGKAIGDALRGKPKSEQHIQNMIKAFAKTKGIRSQSVKNYYASLTPEQKASRAAKISAHTKTAMATPAVKQRLLDGQHAYWSKKMSVH